MKYITVTLNPAIDHSYVLSEPFKTEELNRASSMSEISYSGKGINVSRELVRLGADPKVLCLIGRKGGDEAYERFLAEGLNVFAVRTDGRMRRNVSVIDPYGKSVEINEPGDEIGFEDTLRFFSLYDKLINEEGKKAVIISGSAPPGFRSDVYERLIISASGAGCKVILDADGELLEKGIEGGPDLIKPNAAELSVLTGQKLHGKGESKRLSALAAAAYIYEKTGTAVLCTLGEDGSVYSGPEGKLECEGIPVNIKRFKGAGDIYLARYVYEIFERGADAETAMKKAAKRASEYLGN